MTVRLDLFRVTFFTAMVKYFYLFDIYVYFFFPNLDLSNLVAGLKVLEKRVTFVILGHMPPYHTVGSGDGSHQVVLEDVWDNIARHGHPSRGGSLCPIDKQLWWSPVLSVTLSSGSGNFMLRFNPFFLWIPGSCAFFCLFFWLNILNLVIIYKYLFL